MPAWDIIKQTARALNGRMSKNARNTAKYQEKKERGPIKAFFHITKNENVPAIEQQGLLTNHPNANINSANHPFRKHGTDAGGIWVTTEPTVFPVYGTTIGGKGGNAEARADALSTIKIEVPLPELAKMKAVQDPYGSNILRKGDDPKAIEKFGTWAGIDVPTTVLLNDMKPQWLKNIGYIEEDAPTYRLIDEDEHLLNVDGSWQLKSNLLRMLDRRRLHDFSGLTGHRHNNPQDAAKSPYRFVVDYIDRNRPITERLPEFPEPEPIEIVARKQGAYHGPKYVRDGIAEVPAPGEANRYSVGFIPERNWYANYRHYVKPGEDIATKRSFNFKFVPGAISRGMGGRPSATEPAQAIYDRNFSWPQYKQMIEAGETPSIAAHAASPDYVLDWDNIVYHSTRGYGPKHVVINNLNEGAISRGNDMTNIHAGQTNQLVRQLDADRLRRAIKPFTDSNANIVRNEYKFTMPDDEIRELSRLEIRNNKDNKQLSEAVRNWSRLENSDILKLRQRALDKIEGSWLYDYLTK